MVLRSGKVINQTLSDQKSKDGGKEEKKENNEEKKKEGDGGVKKEEDGEEKKEGAGEEKKEEEGEGEEKKEGEEEKKEENLVDVSGYGAPDPEMFDAYKWVIGKRKHETFTYMSNRIENAKKKEKDRSIASKCGSLVRMIFIYGTVAAFMAPVIYGIYTGFVQGRNDQMAENIKKASNQNASEEDITRAAQEHEAEMHAEKEAKWREFDDQTEKKENEFDEESTEKEQEGNTQEESQEEPNQKKNIEL